MMWMLVNRVSGTQLFTSACAVAFGCFLIDPYVVIFSVYVGHRRSVFAECSDCLSLLRYRTVSADSRLGQQP